MLSNISGFFTCECKNCSILGHVFYHDTSLVNILLNTIEQKLFKLSNLSFDIKQKELKL